MIELPQFYMGRDKTFPGLLTPELRANAAETVKRANTLLARLVLAGVEVEVNPATGWNGTSGWRPPAVNAATPGAALRSAHMTCEAIDLFDPHGEIDEWLMTEAGQKALAEIGLWMEHPSATKGWAHVQTCPQRSFARTGLHCFYP